MTIIYSKRSDEKVRYIIFVNFVPLAAAVSGKSGGPTVTTKIQTIPIMLNRAKRDKIETQKSKN